MKPQAELVLSAQERQKLMALSRRRNTSQALALRLRIVLACARGLSLQQVAGQEQVTAQTVSKWRARFLQAGLPGLADAPRSGSPRTLDDACVRAVIAKTVHAVPAGGGPWTTRSLARECGLSQSAIARIWHAHGLQPHRTGAKTAPKPDDELPTQADRPAR